MNTYPNEAAIRMHLSPRAQGCSIHIFNSIDSTNTEARRGAYPPGSVLLAKEQTGGRGRMGKRFFSPEGGLYVSVVTQAWEHDLDQMTTAAGLAVIDAIRRVTGIETEKRRINDIYNNDLKICGILAEGITDIDTAKIKAVVLGAGLNIAPPPGGFPPELASIATSLLPAEPGPATRNHLAAALIEALLFLK